MDKIRERIKALKLDSKIETAFLKLLSVLENDEPDKQAKAFNALAIAIFLNAVETFKSLLPVEIEKLKSSIQQIQKQARQLIDEIKFDEARKLLGNVKDNRTETGVESLEKLLSLITDLSELFKDNRIKVLLGILPVEKKVKGIQASSSRQHSGVTSELLQKILDEHKPETVDELLKLVHDAGFPDYQERPLTSLLYKLGYGYQRGTKQLYKIRESKSIKAREKQDKILILLAFRMRGYEGKYSREQIIQTIEAMEFDSKGISLENYTNALAQNRFLEKVKIEGGDDLFMLTEIGRNQLLQLIDQTPDSDFEIVILQPFINKGVDIDFTLSQFIELCEAVGSKIEDLHIKIFQHCSVHRETEGDIIIIFDQSVDKYKVKLTVKGMEKATQPF